MNTHALITGAARGIGLEFVRQYAAEGWNVIAAVRNPATAHDLQKLAATHTNIRIEALDVTSPLSIAALAAKLKGEALDLLINNAGIFSGTGKDGRHFLEDGEDTSQTFGTLDAEAWDRVLRVNAIAPIMATEAFAPHLLRGKNPKAVMITSGMGSIGNMSRAGDIAYRTSKAALNAGMKNVAIAMQGKMILACLHPGWVRTDMGGRRANLDAAESVTGMRGVIAALTPAQSGHFFDYTGKEMPW